jgi:hypothetical protein
MPDRMDEVRNLLAHAAVLVHLAPYHPTIAGSFPLGLDTDASDVDILCEAYDLEAFSAALAGWFAGYPGFALHRKADIDPPAVVCRFSVDGWPMTVEIFGQGIPVPSQRGFLHLVAEQRLLEAGGGAALRALRRIRRTGAKTEPAFGQYFGLGPDPYEALLDMAVWPDDRIRAVARRVGTASALPFPAPPT